MGEFFFSKFYFYSWIFQFFFILKFFFFQSGRFGESRHGQLMTSVTAPILDRRNHTVGIYLKLFLGIYRRINKLFIYFFPFFFR